MCTRHGDCSNSLGSLASNRRYCCGGTFCCTLEQYNQGLTSDPFLSSTGALVGIVVGIAVFCLCVGIVVWCWFNSSKKKNRVRKRRARELEMASYPGPYTEDTLPGYSTNPRPHPGVSHEYDYPPDSHVRPAREPKGYPYPHKEPSRRFDDIRRSDGEHVRPPYEERAYHHSTPVRNTRRDERSSRPYRTSIVEYLPHQKRHTSQHPDYHHDYRSQDRRYDRRH